MHKPEAHLHFFRYIQISQPPPLPPVCLTIDPSINPDCFHGWLHWSMPISTQTQALMLLIWGKVGCYCLMVTLVFWTSRVVFCAFVCVHCEGGGFVCMWRPWASSKDPGRGLEQESHRGLAGRSDSSQHLYHTLVPNRTCLYNCPWPLEMTATPWSLELTRRKGNAT